MRQNPPHWRGVVTRNARNSRQRKAGLLLAAAVCLFAVTMLVPPNPWVRHPRDPEAAGRGRAGRLFAVSALFRRIPTGIPFITAHRRDPARSKDRIADNLRFVKERSSSPHLLVELIRQHDPSRYVAEWLTDPANARRLARTWRHRGRAAGGVTPRSNSWCATRRARCSRAWT